MNQTSFCVETRVHAAIETSVMDSLAILPNEVPWQTPLRLWLDSLDTVDLAYRVTQMLSIKDDREGIERIFDACKEGNLLDVEKKVVSYTRIAL